MSSVLLDISDFTGKYAINTGANGATFVQDLMDEAEEYYLTQMLGKDLYDLFIADSSGGTPASPEYLALYDPIQLDSWYRYNYSTGIKEMLKAFVFHEFYNEQSQLKTISGLKKSNPTNSQNQNVNSLYMAAKFNLAVTNYTVIQQYIINNSSTYPDYDGRAMNFKSPF